MTHGRSATGDPGGRLNVMRVPTGTSLRASVPNPGVLPYWDGFIVS
jgi:hypothetical protein